MATSKILIAYETRLAELQMSSSQLRSSHFAALALLGLWIAALVFVAYLSLVRHKVLLMPTLADVPAILYTGRLAKKRHALLLRSLRLQAWYERSIQRLNGDWAEEKWQGSEFSVPDHCYEKDLNILGEASLFQLLCTCRTQVGRRELARYLLVPASVERIRARQDAVRELQPLAALREKLHVLGDFSFQESSWETISEWVDSAAAPAPRWFRAIALISSISLACVLLVAITFYWPWSFFQDWVIALLLLNAALALPYRERVAGSTQGIRAIGNEISLLRQGIELLQNCQFHSPLLSEYVQAVRHSEAAARLRKLERLTAMMIERDKEMFYGISRALLIGTQVFLAVEKWKSENAAVMRAWLSAWGEFEALVALSNYAYENPAHSYPELVEDNSLLDAVAMGHPLLPDEECVRNDVRFDDECKLYIVSGSNMAGKSTLLRTIGLNAVLAYAGAPVCARKLVLSRFAMCASLAIHDSLSNRKSKFLAEMDRLKQALQKPMEDGPVLFLIDEILSGTNSKDRRAAAEVIIRSLIQRGAIGALSTHDLALTELASLPELCARNIHMGSRDDANPLDFDYLVKPGVTNQSSALAMARLAGVNV